MKIVVTDYFRKKYLWKKSSILDELYLISVLQSKEHTFINLKSWFVKIKIKIKWVAHRWIAKIIDDEIYILTIFILKKNKQLWENISWKQSADFIESEYEKSAEDVVKWLYKKYE